MLKFEGIAVGTTIKAFDFEPSHDRPNRYVVGKITGTTVRDGAKFYVINCTEDTGLPRSHRRLGMDIYVPMEMSMDFDGRVTPLDGPCAPKSAMMKELADELGLEVVDLKLSK